MYSSIVAVADMVGVMSDMLVVALLVAYGLPEAMVESQRDWFA